MALLELCAERAPLACESDMPGTAIIGISNTLDAAVLLQAVQQPRKSPVRQMGLTDQAVDGAIARRLEHVQDTGESWRLGLQADGVQCSVIEAAERQGRSGEMEGQILDH